MTRIANESARWMTIAIAAAALSSSTLAHAQQAPEQVPEQVPAKDENSAKAEAPKPTEPVVADEMPAQEPQNAEQAPPRHSEPPRIMPPTATLTEGQEASVSQQVELRVHVLSSSNVYDDLKFDIFSVSSQQVVGQGQGANEATGEEVTSFRLDKGTYKIVKAGESFDTNVDFATVTLGQDTDYLIVVDADSGAFRGSGVVTGELPTGLTIGGVRIALNVGGTLWMNQKSGMVGDTNGTSALVGAFGNFGMVYDEGPSFLTVDAKLQLNLQDAPTSGMFASSDYLEASALYAYNIENDFVGPYARAGLKTSVYPGYLYLSDQNAPVGQVVVNRLDGSVDRFPFGNQANPDDLRIEIAKPLAPLILQEELGANLKAVDLDLKLLELSVATRIGWGFRQGLTRGLLVANREERGARIVLDEVDNYNTHGPLVGASANITFARWLFGQAEVSALVPLQNRSRAGDSRSNQLIVDASGTAGLKFPALTSILHASFDYTFRLQRDGFLTKKTMFDQIVMARISVQLF